MALTDYLVLPAGDRVIAHNDVLVHAGRKLALDAANPVTAALLARNLISAAGTAGKQYEGSAGRLTTYTVQAAGDRRIMHSTANLSTPPAPLAAGATLGLDANEPNCQALVAQGWIA